MLKPEEAGYEASLVVFTLFGQMALGVFAAILASTYLLQIPLEAIALYASTLLMGVGISASVFHASRNRLTAYKIVFNFKSSWLSREVVFAAAFLCFLLLHSSLRVGLSYALNMLYDVVTLFVGVLMLVAMIASYLTIPRPSWRHYNTVVSFCCSTLLLGLSLLGFIYSLKYFATVNASILAYHGGSSLVIAAAALARLASLMLYVKSSNAEPVLKVSRELMLRRFKTLLGLEIAFLLLSFTLGLFVPLFALSGLAGYVNALMLVMLPSVLVSEATGRMLFYSCKGPPKGRVAILNFLARSQGLRYP